jgi:hypothetical protein
MFKKLFLVLSIAAFSLSLVACNKTEINEDAVPEIVVDNSLSTSFEVGDTEPDWTTYFLVEDENDGTIDVTVDMITEDVDMSTAGVYVVRIDVYNSVEAYNFKEITIEVESDIEITVDYIMSEGVVGNTYKFENVEVVYKTNDEYGLYIYDANSESDYNYFYITAYEESLSDAMFDLAVGDMIDIAGELVLYRGNQQPRFENVSIIEKVGTANNPHDIVCEMISINEYYSLMYDTTLDREAWFNFGKCFTVTGMLEELHEGAYYLVDPADHSMGLYAWAYGEGAPIADFEVAENVGEIIAVDTFFYNMHVVSSLNGAEYVRSALVDVRVQDGLGSAVNDVLSQAMPENPMISDDLTLPTSGDGYTVAWTSSDTSVVAEDGTISRGEYNVDVTLTYTVTQGSNTFSGNMNVTVLGLVAPPEVSVHPDAVLDLVKDDTAPDLTTFFTITDETDGEITVTEEMITSTLDMTQIGAYTVTLSVTNSNALTTEKTIIVNVEDPAVSIDAEWLITDAETKLGNLYTLKDVVIISKGYYGDEGFVYDGSNFMYINAYGTDFEAAFIDANIGDTVTLTGVLTDQYTYKYYLDELAFFEVTSPTNNDAFNFEGLCPSVTVAELTEIVENSDTYIQCFDVTGTVVEELYEGTIYYNFADTLDNTLYVIAYSNTPDLPKQAFDLNTGEEITVRMFLNYYREDRSHFGYYWIVDVIDAPNAIDVNHIITNNVDDDLVGLNNVTIVSKTKDETGLYVFDGSHFIYVNAYSTAFEDYAVTLNVGDVINVEGVFTHDYTYKVMIGDITNIEKVSSGTGEFDFTGLCTEVTVSELFAIKDTDAAFINCYDVTGEAWLEAGQYMNFGDLVNTSEYFIAYSYAPLEPKADFDALGDGNEAVVRMFYFRYRDDKTHGGYYWMLDVLNSENPMITDTGEAKLLPKDSVEPDWTTYFSITDDTDGVIDVTPEMLTESVDLTTVGDYDVTITVTDTDGNTVSKTVTITVVDPADINIPWIVDNGLSGQSFTLNSVTVVSKTSDGSGFYVYDGEYFFYVNAYYSDAAVKDAAIALSEGDIIDVSGDLYINYTYKKQLDITAITLVTESTGDFDFTGLCTEVTVSELYAIKDDGMTFTNCYIVTGTVWLEADTYHNMMDTVNTDEYFIEYGYGPADAQAEFELTTDGDPFRVRMFLFRYRDDKSHGGYYWIDEVLED